MPMDDKTHLSANHPQVLSDLISVGARSYLPISQQEMSFALLRSLQNPPYERGFESTLIKGESLTMQ